MSSKNDIREMLTHYLGWPLGFGSVNATAQGLVDSIARMVDGKPWRFVPEPESAPVVTPAEEPVPAPEPSRAKPSTIPPPPLKSEPPPSEHKRGRK